MTAHNDADRDAFDAALAVYRHKTPEALARGMFDAGAAHAREAGAQEPVAVPAKKLYPAHPGALRASIAELDMWLDSSDTLDEIENQQSFGESIMLIVHELKRLLALSGSHVPPADHSEDTLDMVGREKRARALSDLAAADGDLLAAGVDRLPTPPAGEG